MLSLSKNEVLFAAFIFSLCIGSSSIVLAMFDPDKDGKAHTTSRLRVTPNYSGRATKYELPDGTHYLYNEFFDAEIGNWRFDGLSFIGLNPSPQSKL